MIVGKNTSETVEAVTSRSLSRIVSDSKRDVEINARMTLIKHIDNMTEDIYRNNTMMQSNNVLSVTNFMAPNIISNDDKYKERIRNYLTNICDETAKTDSIGVDDKVIINYHNGIYSISQRSNASVYVAVTNTSKISAYNIIQNYNIYTKYDVSTLSIVVAVCLLVTVVVTVTFFMLNRR